MAQAQVRFRRRVLGYDRAAVHAALTSTEDQLRRAEARRDELLATNANVERIGAQVADMLRGLADRAVELEADAAAQAAAVVQGARAEADRIQAEAAAVLASARAEADHLVETARQQQATIAERRETAVISLQIAIDQMGRLATLVDEIDLTAAEGAAPVASAAGPAPAASDADTVVLLPWSAQPAGSQPAPEEAGSPELGAIGTWARSV